MSGNFKGLVCWAGVGRHWAEVQRHRAGGVVVGRRGVNTGRHGAEVQRRRAWRHSRGQAGCSQTGPGRE